MNKIAGFDSPLLLGFDHLQRLLDRAPRASDGYPPYNIERSGPDKLRIVIAVAGFAREELSVSVEENQLVIRGKQTETADRTFLHRGIAAREFHRAFILADGMEVSGAELENGLLSVQLARPKPRAESRKIDIRTGSATAARREGDRQ